MSLRGKKKKQKYFSPLVNLEQNCAVSQLNAKAGKLLIYKT